MLDLAIIGLGSIGRELADQLEGHESIRVSTVLVRPGRRPDIPDGAVIVDSLHDLLGRQPEVVAECAGQGAVRELGEAVLGAGSDLMVISSGALADDTFRERLTERAGRSGARILVPSGAIAGIDGVLAHAAAGLERLVYTSTKPPQAWRGTPAEDLVDLEAVAEPTCFFSGTAREAASQYPQNANIAATVALAGLGLDATHARLVVDPAATGNVGRIEATSRLGTLQVETAGAAASANARTSSITAYSMRAALESSTGTVVLGG